MKTPIKISGKSYEVKPILDLTTSEFIELSQIESLDYVKYIAWQTGVKIEDAFFAVTSKAVEDSIGVIPDISKLPKSKRFDYDKIISTVGQRHQVERSKKEGYELLVYILASAQAQSMSDSEVKELYNKYLQEPFVDILPAGFFFFKILESGKNSGPNNLKRLSRSISTLNLKKRLALKG